MPLYNKEGLTLFQSFMLWLGYVPKIEALELHRSLEYHKGRVKKLADTCSRLLDKKYTSKVMQKGMETRIRLLEEELDLAKERINELEEESVRDRSGTGERISKDRDFKLSGHKVECDTDGKPCGDES